MSGNGTFPGNIGRGCIGIFDAGPIELGDSNVSIGKSFDDGFFLKSDLNVIFDDDGIFLGFDFFSLD